MRFLCVDTSSLYSVVAVGDEKKRWSGGRRLFTRHRCDGLISLVASCLKDARLSLSDIDVFAVGGGPGSFTGLRIGVATVKGLAYASRKPCLPFSSLEAVAFNDLPAGVRRLAVVVDARRSSVYGAFFECRKDARGVRRLSRDFLCEGALARKKVLRRLSAAEGGALAGDAAPLLFSAPEDPKDRSSCGLQCLPKRCWYPTPDSIWRLAVASARESGTVSAEQLLPTYLYPRDCQIRTSGKKT